MIILTIGVALWAAAHFFRRAMPAARANLGEKRGKGVVAIVLVASVVFMIIGYRSVETIDLLWDAPSYARHINNLLVLFAIFLMSPAPRKGKLFNGMRHPMLIGFALWAAAHLLVNGDMASLVLFGGLLAWALVEIAVINKAEGTWTPTGSGSLAKDGMFFGASIVLMGVIGFIHGLLGPSPF